MKEYFYRLTGFTVSPTGVPPSSGQRCKLQILD